MSAFVSEANSIFGFYFTFLFFFVFFLLNRKLSLSTKQKLNQLYNTPHNYERYIVYDSTC